MSVYPDPRLDRDEPASFTEADIHRAIAAGRLEGIREAAEVVKARRAMLLSQTVVLDVERDASVYDIAITAIEAVASKETT